MMLARYNKQKGGAAMKTIHSMMVLVPLSVLCSYVQNVNASERGEDSQAASRASTQPNQRSQRKGSGGTIEEVVVTAQKRGDERLQDVPIPIAVLSATSLMENGATGMKDYFNKVPGVALVSGVGGTTSVLIRGVAANGGNDNPTVGVTIDDAPFGASTFLGGGLQPIDMDPNELAQIEVLRGPQGTLYGASSIGGLLRYVMVEPSLEELGGRLMVSTLSPRNNDGLDYDLRGAINLPITSNLAVRVSAFNRDENGFVDDTYSGREGINGGHSYGGRVAMLWRLNDDWSVKLSAVRQLLNTDAANVVDVSAVEQDRLESSDYIHGYSGSARSMTFLTGTVNGQISDIDITSISAYTRSESVMQEAFTRGGLLGLTRLADPTADAGLFADTQPVKKFSQELRVNIPMGERINWLVGAFYTKEEGVYRETISSAVRATGDLRNYLGDAVNIFNTTSYEEIATFVNMTVRFTDRFDVQFGGRVSENRQYLYSVLSGVIFPGRPTPANPILDGPIRSKDSPFTYLVTPRFKLTDDWMIYSRIASGYRPGGPKFFAGLSTEPTLKADTTENYELGVKGNLFSQVLSVDASAYYIDWKDVPVNVLLNGGPASHLINAGGAISKGIELSLGLQPFTGFTISAWGAWGDAYISELPTDAAATFDEGDRLPYSPRFSGNVAIGYERPIFGDLTGNVGVAARYVGARVRDIGGSDADLPDYTQVDANIGVRSGSWTVNAYVNNVTDERGRIGVKALTAGPPVSYLIIRPRTIGLSIAKDF